MLLLYKGGSGFIRVPPFVKGGLGGISLMPQKSPQAPHQYYLKLANYQTVTHLNSDSLNNHHGAYRVANAPFQNAARRRLQSPILQ